eukprot:s766_g18.t1
MLKNYVPHGISEHTWRTDIQMMLLKSGKYFDRLLEDNSVLWRVLGSVYGGTHLHQVLHDLYGVQSVRDAASSLSMMSTSAFDNAEVRRRSCMDIAMWGNAVRHKEAFRRDTGELTRPMVTALFTCLVHPNCTEGTTTVKDPNPPETGYAAHHRGLGGFRSWPRSCQCFGLWSCGLGLAAAGGHEFGAHRFCHAAETPSNWTNPATGGHKSVKVVTACHIRWQPDAQTQYTATIFNYPNDKFEVSEITRQFLGH